MRALEQPAHGRHQLRAGDLHGLGLDHGPAQAAGAPRGEDHEGDKELHEGQLDVGGDEIGERLVPAARRGKGQHLHMGGPRRRQQGDGEQAVVGLAQRVVGERIGAPEHDEVAATLGLGDEPGVGAAREAAVGRRAGPEQGGLGNEDVAHLAEGGDVTVAGQISLHEAEDRRPRRAVGVERRIAVGHDEGSAGVDP